MALLYSTKAFTHSTMALVEYTSLYYGSTWFYFTFPWALFALLDCTLLYNAWLYMTLLDSTIPLLDSTQLYLTLPSLYSTLLDSIYLTLPSDSTQLYSTLLDSTIDPFTWHYNASTTLYFTLQWHYTAWTLVVCIVGKMAQDVGMVESIVVSFPFSLVGFWVFHPYIHLFSFRKCSCDFGMWHACKHDLLALCLGA